MTPITSVIFEIYCGGHVQGKLDGSRRSETLVEDLWRYSISLFSHIFAVFLCAQWCAREVSPTHPMSPLFLIKIRYATFSVFGSPRALLTRL